MTKRPTTSNQAIQRRGQGSDSMDSSSHVIRPGPLAAGPVNRVQSRGARPAAPKPHSPSIPLLPLSVGPKFQEGGGLTFQTQVLVGLQVFSIRCPPCKEVHPKVCQYSYQIQSCLRPFLGFPGGSVVKDLPASSGDDPWVGKIPLRRKWQPTARFLPGKSHRQRSLACCSPWGHRAGHNLATEEQKNQGPSS